VAAEDGRRAVDKGSGACTNGGPDGASDAHLNAKHLKRAN